MVSAYMRANAKRTIQKTAEEAREDILQEEPSKEGADDKLEFSSEFTNQDMGLSSQGGAAGLLRWKRKIEEEDEEERKRREEAEDDEQAEEWSSGGWRDKQQDDQSPQQDEDEAKEDEAKEDEAKEAEAFPRSHETPAGASRIEQTLSPPEAQAKAPGFPAPAPLSLPPTEQASAAALAPEEPSWGDESRGPAVPVPIAEVARPSGATLAPMGPLPEKLRPIVSGQLPARGQMAQLDPTLVQAARRLILNPPEEDGYEECVRLLARFGLGALRICSHSKVTVEILDEAGFGCHGALGPLGLSPKETPTEGAYVVGRRLVLVDRRCLTGKPRFFHPALYYFAHAFDHAQGGETFSSRKAAAVVACFEASTRGLSGFDFIDELAAADPVRYFARSVAVFLGHDDCSDPLWSHQDLYDFDRSMYDYLQYLFARLTA